MIDEVIVVNGQTMVDRSVCQVKRHRLADNSKARQSLQDHLALFPCCKAELCETVQDQSCNSKSDLKPVGSEDFLPAQCSTD